MVAIMSSLALVLVAVLSYGCAYQHPKTVMERVTYEKHRYPITLGHTFFHLPQFGQMVVDKTLLLKEVMALDEKIIVLALPLGFGKTMSLTMIKSFFEIHVDKNAHVKPRNETQSYKFFKLGEIDSEEGPVKFAPPPLISNHAEFFDKYHGNYPVVYLDLLPEAGKDLDFLSAMDEFKHGIQECYLQHKYLMAVYSAVLKDTSATDEQVKEAEEKALIFSQFMDSWKTQLQLFADLAKALEFLIKALYDHFGKRVIVLIREYDIAIHRVFGWIYNATIYRGDNFREVRTLGFFCYMYKYTFKKSKYVEKAIFTSRYSFMMEKLLESIDGVLVCDIFDNKLSEFFGFTREEVDQLFTNMGVPTIQTRQAFDWYEGYTYRNSNVSVFNPRSIASFLQHMQIGNYWEIAHGVRYSREMRRVFLADELRSVVDTLMKGEPVEVDFNDVHVSKDDWQLLEKIFCKKWHLYQKEKNLVLKLLCANGYLAFAGFQKKYKQINRMKIRLANKEVYSLCAKLFEIDITRMYPWLRRTNFFYYFDPTEATKATLRYNTKSTGRIPFWKLKQSK